MGLAKLCVGKVVERFRRLSKLVNLGFRSWHSFGGKLEFFFCIMYETKDVP